MRFLLLFFFSTHILAYPAQADSQNHLIVLDIDRVLMKEKEATSDLDPKDFFSFHGTLYRISLFVPEYLVALQYYFEKHHEFPLELAIFSGGKSGRNDDFVQNFQIADEIPLSLWIPNHRIKSVEDLTPMASIPNGMTPYEFINQINAQGGQDSVPFFKYFKKDLRIFNLPLDHIILVDDNANATPDEQRGNILVVARPDTLTSEFIWAPDGQRDPVQIARAKYRLVRVLGLFSFAIQDLRLGRSKTLPEALHKMQWEDGIYREKHVNEFEVYMEGLKILSWAYDNYLEPLSPRLKRQKSDFKIERLFPRPQDCSSVLKNTRGVLPWEG